jgi:Na+/proline symporter
VEKLGGVFSIGIAFSGISSGTLLGLFTMGMISKKFNTKGALSGAIVSTIVVSVIAIGAQINIFEGNLRYETLPMNIENCDASTRMVGMT